MNSTKHTPGPWLNNGIVSKSSQAPLIKTLVGNQIIAMVWSGNKADGKLIRAAPDLLEACRDALDCLVGNEISPRVQNILRMAIEKATE